MAISALHKQYKVKLVIQCMLILKDFTPLFLYIHTSPFRVPYNNQPSSLFTLPFHFKYAEFVTYQKIKNKVC